jgi:hypothetical protein
MRITNESVVMQQFFQFPIFHNYCLKYLDYKVEAQLFWNFKMDVDGRRRTNRNVEHLEVSHIIVRILHCVFNIKTFVIFLANRRGKESVERMSNEQHDPRCACIF